MPLHAFLADKPLFYETIDTTRMPRIYAKIAEHFVLPKVIQIVGTNGKGTTGRFLASLLMAQGLHVGHYTSPHIVRFHERIWLDGEEVSDALLEEAHGALLGLLAPSDADALSYFEYTTLLAMWIFQRCAYVVLEAGMGGEWDATSVFPKMLSIITPIGLDHQAFLGESIEAIALTKVRSAHNPIVLATQREPLATEVVRSYAKERGLALYEVEQALDPLTCKQLEAYATKHHVVSFLVDNLKSAVVALTILGYDIAWEQLRLFWLAGRFMRYAPNVILDVGHNPLAAHALSKALGRQKVILLYNTYADKDYVAILEILKPHLEAIALVPIAGARVVDPKVLCASIERLGIPLIPYGALDSEKKYLVFGSFSVVETFLKGAHER